MPNFDVTLTVSLTEDQLQTLAKELGLTDQFFVPREVATWLVDDVLRGTSLRQAVEQIDLKRTSIIRKGM